MSIIVDFQISHLTSYVDINASGEILFSLKTTTYWIISSDKLCWEKFGYIYAFAWLRSNKPEFVMLQNNMRRSIPEWTNQFFVDNFLSILNFPFSVNPFQKVRQTSCVGIQLCIQVINLIAITFKCLPFCFSHLSPTNLIQGVSKAFIFEIVFNYIFTECKGR